MLFSTEKMDFGYDAGSVFSGVDLEFNEGDRVGLIGANGAGKTTLLGVLLGELEPSGGSVFRRNGLGVGYLKQNSGISGDNFVYDEMRSVFSDVLSAISRQERLCEQMAILEHGSPEYRTVSAEFERLGAYIASKDGYSVDVRIKTVLGGMGFSDKTEQRISSMSGGEKTRLALAKLLLEAPELLVLDEPTNHLDFKTLSWLEGYLGGYKGGLLIVSHDRYFLDKMVTKIWELEDGRVETFCGNYTKYKTIKSELIKFRQREYDKQQLQIAKMEDYARRNIARASSSKSAKSRLHQLEHIEVLQKPRTYVKPPKFAFSFPSESSRLALTVDGLDVNVGERKLIGGGSFSVESGERIGILGANGTGKSTLVHTLMAHAPEAMKTAEGALLPAAVTTNADFSVRFGFGVTVSYYDQENLNIDFSKTVLEELWDRHRRESQTRLRAILGGLGLGEDDVDKPISVLSGGERAKLGFAIVMAENANMLVLDEPTNHLDLIAREALEDALRSYGGTVIFVSHDRYFLDRIATSILELDNMTLTRYEGNYTSYEARKKTERERAAAESFAQEADASLQRKQYRSAKDRSLQARQKLKVAELEKQIELKESEAAKLGEEMLNPQVLSDYKAYSELNSRYTALSAEIEELYEQWSQLSAQLN